MANDVWVYIEHKDGGISPMSFELLGIGKELADWFWFQCLRICYRR